MHFVCSHSSFAALCGHLNTLQFHFSIEGFRVSSFITSEDTQTKYNHSSLHMHSLKYVTDLFSCFVI